MRKIMKMTMLGMVSAMTLWSCSRASGQGSITMVVSGSVHGQLDPCG